MKNAASTAAVMVLFVASFVCAQAAAPGDYPVRPVKIIVPFPTGGTNDIVARAVGDRLSKALKQQVIVENRGGAGGLIGTKVVAGARPDGYTLLVGNAGALTVGVSLYSKAPYNVLEDFIPISLLADITIVLAVHPSLPARSVKQLIALAKVHPGKLSAALPGTNSIQHLLTELFKRRAGIDFVNISYNGGGPAMIDLVAGQNHMSFINLPTIRQFILAGRLRPIAVAGARRSELLPDVATLEESGLPGLTAAPWNALLTPAGTPKEIVTRLSGEVMGMMRTADMKQLMGNQGANALSSTPEDTYAFIRDETAKWAKVIKDTGIRAD
ncbi:MAG: tripartite tricarboxylate transporter substrate binding protein [Betaproteobacteria bacterium]|nr:tripartite tricarboxylate transporter substrate binding protein [Betaproteobacteria bacterium]